MTRLSETTHGLSIPPTHPRLWFDGPRLARAKTWYRSHPFTPASGDYGQSALRGLLDGDPSQCRTAIESALSDSAGMRVTGTACDPCRWSGEAVILVYDWCYPQMTAQERASFISSTNKWVDHWRTQSWGGPGMHQSNYYWGYLRNELEWAIASYGDNTEMCGAKACVDTFLDDVFTTRLGNDFYPSTLPGFDSSGGVGSEGSQYGLYIPSYATVPLDTCSLLGRDLWTESNYWREQVYQLVYSTSPAQTSGMGYTYFPYSDDEIWLNGSEVGYTASNFMTAAAMRWPNANVGRHARRWLNATGAGSSAATYVRSVDSGGASAPFETLPLDYYASGTRYLYGRNAWGPSATTFFLQLGDRATQGHSHVDWGTWQIWRNARYLSRETVGYANSIVGYRGSGSVGTDQGIAHNSLLVNGTGPGTSPWTSGTAVVNRLESQPAYVYAAVNLTPPSNSFVRLEREFVFVRSLETLVILDRMQSRESTDVKTFVAHCETNPTTTKSGATCTNGTQALVMTTLLPASRSYRVVNEGKGGQYRIEIDTTPGTAQSYILTVLQAKDSGAASLMPGVVDDGGSYTVTLNAANAITFKKGMTSSGGSITISGNTSQFRTGIQSMTVTDDGPAWQ